jgi:hypothetical protein
MCEMLVQPPRPTVPRMTDSDEKRQLVSVYEP